MVVDFPAPFGPRKPCTWPVCTSRSRPSRATVDPKDFASSAAGVNFYGKDRNAEFFAGGEGGEAGKLIKLGGDIWGGFGKLKMDIKYDDLVDTSFLAK